MKGINLGRACELWDDYVRLRDASENCIGAYREDNTGRQITWTVRVYTHGAGELDIQLPTSVAVKIIDDEVARLQKQLEALGVDVWSRE